MQIIATEQLENMEIYKLTALFCDLMEYKKENGMTIAENNFMKNVEQIRREKIKEVRKKK